MIGTSAARCPRASGITITVAHMMAVPCMYASLSALRQVTRLYHLYSGPSVVPMTLRGLLRLSRDAGLEERARIAPEDVKKVRRKSNQHTGTTLNNTFVNVTYA